MMRAKMMRMMGSKGMLSMMGEGKEECEKSMVDCFDNAKKCMEMMEDEDFSPKHSFEGRSSSEGKSAQRTGFTTSELDFLFKEWTAEIESELLNLIEEKDEFDSSALAEELGVSKECLLTFVSKFIREERVKGLDFEVN